MSPRQLSADKDEPAQGYQRLLQVEKWQETSLTNQQH